MIPILFTRRLKQPALLIFTLACLLSASKPRPIVWTAIGDSITYLNDHPEQTGNRITKGYLTLISEKYPAITYINKGYNGWSAVRIAQQIENLGLVKSDVYTIFLGTNDWWQGQPLGTFEDYLNNTGPNTINGAFRVIIDKLRGLNPKARIMLITPMQRGDFVYIADMKNNAYGSYRDKNGRKLSDIADLITRIGRHEKLPVADLYYKSGITPENMVRFKRLREPGGASYRNYSYPEYTAIAFDPEKDEYPYPPEAVFMTYDGLHPSDEGYRIIAGMVMKKWKGKKKPSPYQPVPNP